MPVKTHDLRQHVKNIAGLAAICFGKESMLFHCLKEVENHIEYNEISYSYEFLQDSMFGGSLLDRIHWRMHRFFDSCAHGEKSQIDLERLNFSDMMQQVEQREYSCKPPVWLANLVKSREKKPVGT